MSGLLTDSRGASQSVELVLGPRPANTSLTITLTPHLQCEQHLVNSTTSGTDKVLCTVVLQVNLTLRSVTGGKGSLTKMIPCISYSMREATTTRYRNNNYLEAENTKQCLSCLDSWLYWVQPQHWIGLHR